MLYLFADSSVICKWCSTTVLQIVEGDPSKVIVRLCPACDWWPKSVIKVGPDLKIEKDS